jgi:hypothetical protein
VFGKGTEVTHGKKAENEQVLPNLTKRELISPEFKKKKNTVFGKGTEVTTNSMTVPKDSFGIPASLRGQYFTKRIGAYYTGSNYPSSLNAGSNTVFR